MAEQLSIINGTRAINANATTSTSLIGRGLGAIQRKEIGLARPELDALYRQARDVYNIETGYEPNTGFQYLSAEKQKQMEDIFIVFQQLADKGYGKAYFPLAGMYGGRQEISENIYKFDYYSRMAFDWCFANQGLNDPEIELDLGCMYAYGRGVDLDHEQAVFWYRKAAEQGHIDAHWLLGQMYYRGCGIKQDDEQALFWFRKASEQGSSCGMGCLDRMYAEGRGEEQDKEAAEQGNAQAQFNLGERYRFRDVEQAVSWYEQAADQGHADAQCKLGWMYANDRDVEQDDEQAVFWYLKAAEQGHAHAQYLLGEEYASYSIVLEEDDNEEKAIFWYRKAAEQGHTDAQFNLGVMYDEGFGVEQDDEQAVFWYRKAAEQGDSNAQGNLTKRGINWKNP